MRKVFALLMGVFLPLVIGVPIWAMVASLRRGADVKQKPVEKPE
jgi:hypothetical protein